MLYSLEGSAPELRLCGAGHFIAPSAALIGQVILEARAGVRFHAVLRGDAEPLHAGEESSVRDFAMLHADPGFPLEIAARVTIGRRTLVRAAGQTTGRPG